MSILGWVFTGIVLAAVGFSLYVRFASVDKDYYSESPSTAESDGKPHEYRLVGEKAPTFNASADQLATIVNEVVLNEPRTKLFAGDPKTGKMTYVQRSFLMGYPDFISIEIEPIDNAHARMEILSRSRYGTGDMGVNKKRVTDWISKIQAQIPN